MKYQKLDQYSPMPTQITRVKKCGNRVELMTCSTTNKNAHTIRIDKDHMLILKTGEVIDIVHQEKRTDDLTSVRKSLQKGRDMINTNVVDPDKCLWVTLTYKENMQDAKKLTKDFNKFVKKFRYHYGDCEYIAAAEPQERGAWHMHIIFIFPDTIDYDNYLAQDLYELWDCNGWVTTTPCYSSGTGDYLCAYLSNIPTEEKDGMSKKLKKGARLHLYPAGMQIFRYSKGLKKPEIETKMYVYASDEYHKYAKIYEKSVQIEDENEKFCTIINYQVYDLAQKREEPEEIPKIINEITESLLDPLLI